jgi:hypothetical protein
MTDFALSASDKDTMYAAFNALGLLYNGVPLTQGTLSDGTQWAFVDQGARYYAAGDPPETVTDGLYWVALRWNGAAPPPSNQPGVTIAWSSADPDAGPYPEGLTRFA